MSSLDPNELKIYINVLTCIDKACEFEANIFHLKCARAQGIEYNPKFVPNVGIELTIFRPNVWDKATLENWQPCLN